MKKRLFSLVAVMIIATSGIFARGFIGGEFGIAYMHEAAAGNGFTVQSSSVDTVGVTAGLQLYAGGKGGFILNLDGYYGLAYGSKVLYKDGTSGTLSLPCTAFTSDWGVKALIGGGGLVIDNDKVRMALGGGISYIIERMTYNTMTYNSITGNFEGSYFWHTPIVIGLGATLMTNFKLTDKFYLGIAVTPSVGYDIDMGGFVFDLAPKFSLGTLF